MKTSTLIQWSLYYSVRNTKNYLELVHNKSTFAELFTNCPEVTV